VIFDVMLRLEPDPHQRDLERGWAAELADPAWLLGRQWQMGEHAGEDSSSPMVVTFKTIATPIGAATQQQDLDPATVPAQAVLESEPGDWWTIGRRIRIGRAVTAAATNEARALPPTTPLLDLPVPYRDFNGGPDGRELWLHRTHTNAPLEEAWFGQPSPPHQDPLDMWDPAELSYTAQFPAADTTLSISRHDGGNLDWYHADADRPPTLPTATTAVSVTPGRLRYPGAPLPRWWQIEDAAVSIGGQAPDRAALATVVLIDLIVNHSDDWYTFSVPATAGHICTLTDVTIIDSFGEKWVAQPPPDWSLFTTTGLEPNSLVLWATAPTPLAGPVIDDVVIGIDEDSNMVWAVEQIVAGHNLDTPPPYELPQPAAQAAAPHYSYLPMTPIPPYWHPYLLDDTTGERRFVQGRAYDMTKPHQQPEPLPKPTSDLLKDPHATPPGDPFHHLVPAAIPAEGLRVQRRIMLTRSTTGDPVLWTQRRRQNLETPPTTSVRFDIFRPA
jgi:hypothetical protein